MSAGGEIFVTWRDESQISHCMFRTSAHATIIRSDLSVERIADFPTSSPRAIAWDGSEFLVTWTDDQVYVQRYSRTGEAISDAVALTEAGQPKGASVIDSAGGGTFVAYTRPLPEASGSGAMRLVGRMIFDTQRRRAVMPH